MSDTVFEAGALRGLAWLKLRPTSLFGCEDGLVSPQFGVAERQSVRRRSQFARHAARLSMASACCLAVALAAGWWPNLPATAPDSSAPPLPVWRDIVKPVRIFNLEAPIFAGTPLVYAARRHTFGGGREDVLALGALDSDKPSIRLRIFRRGDEIAPKIPLFAALAHEAAQVGLSIGRSGLPDVMPTRFGRFEIADISLGRQDGVETPCDGFRLILDKPALSVTGLACGGHGKTLSHAEIGCLIERLDVASARDDRDLVDFFAASELHRNASCAGMRLGPDGMHAAWLDDPALPVPPHAAVGPKSPTGHKPATTRKRLRRR